MEMGRGQVPAVRFPRPIGIPVASKTGTRTCSASHSADKGCHRKWSVLASCGTTREVSLWVSRGLGRAE